jgi:hypothetical protein
VHEIKHDGYRPDRQAHGRPRAALSAAQDARERPTLGAAASAQTLSFDQGESHRQKSIAIN